jgi:LPPG:FO 2-phospho-L-lactate transferase
MKIAALAGGVGAGKFLRGVVRAIPPADLTVIVNTGDDIRIHGLHVSPDLDSVTYWLAGVMDRERGWGRDGETFRTTDELRRLGARDSWFGLGELDMATHLLRTTWLDAGRSLTDVTDELARTFGVTARILPMSDDPAPTRLVVLSAGGEALDLHFQEYWVQRGGQDQVKAIRYHSPHGVAGGGDERPRPAPGVIDAIARADVVLICPSNPIASVDPILAIPGIRPAVAARRNRVVAVSPIVGGAPLRGMADRLLPVAGVEVSAVGVAEHYADLLGAFLFDIRDRSLMDRISPIVVRAEATDTVMHDDDDAERVARAAIGLVTATGAGEAGG